jgi:hypothetical protein
MRVWTQISKTAACGRVFTTDRSATTITDKYEGTAKRRAFSLASRGAGFEYNLDFSARTPR